VDSAQRWLEMREEDAMVPADAACEPLQVDPKGDPLKGELDEWRFPANILMREQMIKFGDSQPEASSPVCSGPVGFVRNLDAAYNLSKGAA